MVCLKCGSKLREQARFCSSCGHKINAAASGIIIEQDKTGKTDKHNIDEKDNEEYVINETHKIIKQHFASTNFPSTNCTSQLCSLHFPGFKDLKNREIYINFTYKDLYLLMEKKGIEFKDGLWKKDFEGICALCSLRDTPDLVYHCIKGDREHTFCCEIHGYLYKSNKVSGIYRDFIFPLNWSEKEIEDWKEDMKKSEETRKNKTLDYYKTGMLETCYCCICDKEIEYIEHYKNIGLCETCKNKEDISDNEKLWQREVSKYKIGAVFKVNLPDGEKINQIEGGQKYQLMTKMGKRVYLARLDIRGRVIKGKGDWFLGIPGYFSYQSNCMVTKKY